MYGTIFLFVNSSESMIKMIPLYVCKVVSYPDLTHACSVGNEATSDIFCTFAILFFLPAQMFFPSLMHTLENTPHLVPTSFTSTVMEMSLDWLTVHPPPHPHVVHRMLLEFAAKEILLQVSNVQFHIYEVLIAERLSTKLIIVQHSQFAFVCMYVCMYTVRLKLVWVA